MTNPLKIKSVYIASAAIIVAVTGARAADPIIVEAEPEEYMRICDAYGTGFFFIPGTETCLKFSGYVRVDYGSSHIHDGYIRTKRAPNSSTSNLYDTIEVTDIQKHYLLYRGRLNLDARNETEWGTLRSQIRFQGDGGADNSDSDSFSGSGESPDDAAVGLDRALISHAGFRLGYSDDYWKTIGKSGYYKAVYDGIYGDQQGLFLDYTFAAEGFSATAGAGDNRRSGTAGQPDPYVGASYSGTWGRIFGTYHHDSSQAAGAWKVGAELNLSDYLPGSSIKGWYMADSGDTDYVKGHVWGISAKVELSDKLSLFSGYSDYECGTSGSATSCASSVFYDTSYAQWTTGLRWSISSQLYMQVEYAKFNFDFQRNGVIGSGLTAAQADDNRSRLSRGTVNFRVLRSF